MQNKRQRWTVVDLIQWSTRYLQEKGLENPRLNVERMLSHVLGLSRVELYLQFAKPLTPAELADFKALLLRRAAREPLQYILGETEFYSLPFKVRPGVLIPRPETEILVQRAVALAKEMPGAVRFLDVGTGCGAIAVALAKELPQAHGVAVDISEAALQVARENADLNQVTAQLDFLQLDVLAGDALQRLAGKFQLILANPPYITRGEAGDLQPEVVEFEPPEALFAAQAMQFYQAIAVMARAKLAAGGHLLCEIAPHRVQEAKAILSNLAFKNISVDLDLSGKERVIGATISETTDGGKDCD